MQQPAKTISEFCVSNKVSRAFYYKHRAAGKGPREMAVGRGVRITPEAEDDWRREREAEAAAKRRPS